MRWFPAMLMVFLLTGCIQEAKWTWTGDTPNGDVAADQVRVDGAGEVSPSDVPGGKDTDVDAPKDTTENPLDACQKCQPAMTQLGWSPLEDGFTCGVEKRCWQGSCCDYGAFCADKECEDDGCGEVCGECDGGDVCVDQICCTPDCSDNQCGGDGCGGICGTCQEDQTCVGYACIHPDVVWSKGIGGEGIDMGHAVDVGPAGEIYIVSRYGTPGIQLGDTYLPVIEGQDDVFMAKLDADGLLQWSFGWDGPYNHSSVTSDGTHVFLAGTAASSSATVNGVTFVGPTNSNGFVLEMDADGGVVWSKQVGAKVSGIGIDAQGNRTIVGTSINGDVYVTSYSQLDQPLWSSTFGGADGESVFAMHTDTSSNIFVGGAYLSDEITFASQTIQHTGGFYDGFLFKVDAQGQPQWVLSVGGADGHEIVHSVATDSEGNAYFAGTFTSTTVLVDGDSYSNSVPLSYDLFLGKISPTGTLCLDLNTHSRSQGFRSGFGSVGLFRLVQAVTFRLRTPC